jgi:hypothetical protein
MPVALHMRRNGRRRAQDREVWRFRGEPDARRIIKVEVQEAACSLKGSGSEFWAVPNGRSRVAVRGGRTGESVAVYAVTRYGGRARR